MGEQLCRTIIVTLHWLQYSVFIYVPANVTIVNCEDASESVTVSHDDN